MFKKLITIFAGLLLAQSAFASCNGIEYSLAYFGYKLDGSTYRLAICGSYHESNDPKKVPNPWVMYAIPWNSPLPSGSCYATWTVPYVASSYATSTTGDIVSPTGQRYSFNIYFDDWAKNIGLRDEVSCAYITDIVCSGTTFTNKPSGFSQSDIATCLGTSLNSRWFVDLKFMRFGTPASSFDSLPAYDPDEQLNFQDTEVAPVLTYTSPLSSATTTFSSSSAPFFFSGSVSYASAVHSFSEICLQYSTTSGVFNDQEKCCSQILSQNTAFNITCTPNASSTYYYRYKLQGTSKGQLAEYVFSQASNPFIVNGTPSSWAISQNPQFASTTAKTDCSTLGTTITDIFLCEIKNIFIDVFLPTQNSTDAFKSQADALIKKFPFNYINELKSFFDYLANYSYSTSSPTWSINGLPYTPSTSTKSVQPFNALPTTTISLLGNKTPIEIIRFTTKLVMLLIFVQVCYLTFVRFVLDTPE